MMAVVSRIARRPGWAWRVSLVLARVLARLRLFAEIWNEAQENARNAHARYPFAEW